MPHGGAAILTNNRGTTMVTITRSELNKMNSNILDEDTGLTEYDLFEHNHQFEDWNIIEDTKEN